MLVSKIVGLSVPKFFVLTILPIAPTVNTGHYSLDMQNARDRLTASKVRLTYKYNTFSL